METVIGPVRAPAERRVLGRYTLLERLGSGGFGEVWRAQDTQLGRLVAVKAIADEAHSEEIGQRAAREAQAVARLSHPAIVALYEAGREDGVWYLVSELVQGATLAQLCAESRLDQLELLEIGLALCDALAHAHARGVIHRDVKPQNILVPDDPQDGSTAAKLADFGGAQLLGEQALTRTGETLGTLAYMSPEQCDGKQAGPASDLYSLALVLYEALTGENPVRGATPAATVRRIGSRLPPLRRRVRSLPRDLTAAVDRALLPSPRDRGEIADLAGALARTVDLWRQQDAAEGGERTRVRRSAAAHLAEREDPIATARARAAALDADAQTHAHAGAGDLATVPAGMGQSSDRTARTLRPRRPQPGPDGHPPGGSPPLAGERPTTTSPVPGGDGRADRLYGRERAPVPAARGGVEDGVLVLPKLIWMLAAAAAVIWQLAAGRPGLSLLIFAAALPLLIALPRRAGPLWLLVGLAPLLGLIDLAAAFPAVVGRARRPGSRLALGALGYWWLCLAEVAFARSLPPAVALTRATSSASALRSVSHSLTQALASAGRLPYSAPASLLRPVSAWDGSLSASAHALSALLSVSVLAGVAVWALGALALPWLMRGRSVLGDLLPALLWAAAMLLGPSLAAAALHGAAPASLGSITGGGAAVWGAVLAVLIAVGSQAIGGASRARPEAERAA